MDLKSKIILISGPTASGKSNFAISLAKKINGEIINSDSMQVYKELRILTARPKQKDYQKIRHHLYGFLNVTKNFSTGEWLKLCQKKIKEIQSRNKIPILVGGTGLYFKALTDGLVKIPNIPLKVRNKIRNLQKKLGQKKFYSKLLKLDPNIKGKIIETDAQRSIRAYEVKKLTKKSLYKWFKETKTFFDKNEFVMTYVDYPRDKLIKNIKKRIDRMFDLGAIKEVKKFNLIKINKLNSVNHVIGIKEINSFLSKKAELNDIKEQILIKTRQYAKRQSTWSRGHMINWHKIDPKSKNPFKKILK